MLVTLILVVLTTGCASRQFAPAVPMTAASFDETRTVTRIALGSCFNQRLDSSIFDHIRAGRPDLFVFLGDNVYAADESSDPKLASLREAYAQLAAVESFESLRQTTPLAVVWDDHDYGKDDAGGDFATRDFSEALFEYVWAIDDEDPRAARPGIYFERRLGPPGRRVQIIALDTRFFRTPLTRNPAPDGGRYIANTDPAQNLLGDEQWTWLKTQFEKPADLRLLITSIQLIADGHQWEAWAMMPRERQRLYNLIEETSPNGLVVVSGDRHSAAMYRENNAGAYPLYEMTTSSLNVPLSSFVPDLVDEPGPNRLTRPYYESNFGLIDIDWETGTIALRLMDENGHPVQELSLQLGSLQAM